MYFRTGNLVNHQIGEGLNLPGNTGEGINLPGSGLVLAGDKRGSGINLPGSGLKKKLIKQTKQLDTKRVAQIEKELDINIDTSKRGKSLETHIISQIANKHNVSKSKLRPHVQLLVKNINNTKGSQQGNGFFDFILAPIKGIINVGKSLLGFGIEEVGQDGGRNALRRRLPAGALERNMEITRRVQLGEREEDILAEDRRAREIETTPARGAGIVEDKKLTTSIVHDLIKSMTKEYKLGKSPIPKKLLNEHVLKVVEHKESKQQLAFLLFIIIESSLIKKGKMIDPEQHHVMLINLHDVVEGIFQQHGAGLFSSLFNLGKKLLPKLIKPLGKHLIKAGIDKISNTKFGQENPELLNVGRNLATKGLDKLHGRFN